MSTTLSIPDIAGRAVLVTGASTGIGAAVALGFAHQGARVAVHYNASRAEAEIIVDKIRVGGGQATLIQGDVSQPGEADRVVAAAAKALGGLDGLVNNAGGLLGRRPTAETDDALFAKVMDLNARSVLSATRAAMPHLMKRQGFIINTTSVAARNGGGNGAYLYAAAKGFVSTLTRGHAKEFASAGVRVNAVAPGIVVTPFHDRYTDPELLEAQRATVPLGRVGTPDECVGAFLFLASNMLSVTCPPAVPRS